MQSPTGLQETSFPEEQPQVVAETLRVGKRSQERLLHLQPYPFGGGERGLTTRREYDDVAPPVLRAPPAFDEAALLQPVQQIADRRPIDPEPRRHLELGERLARRDRRQ